MKNQRMTTKTISVLLAISILFTSCRSTTMIVSNPSGAKLYLNDELVGTTPYTHKDSKIVGSRTTVKLEKDGYETFNTSFSKNEKLDVGALIGGILVDIPFLWIMKYKNIHSYELIPNESINSSRVKQTYNEPVRSSKMEQTYNEPVRSLNVGQSYQGGIIAYVDETGKHGLIAAPEDQSSGVRWNIGGVYETGAFGTKIGTGKSNTAKIVQALGNGNYAAKLCYNLKLNGYDDWFLPSYDELKELYKNREAIGMFDNAIYWSSSEYSASNAWAQDFENNGQCWCVKSYTYRVRAVRAF